MVGYISCSNGELDRDGDYIEPRQLKRNDQRAVFFGESPAAHIELHEEPLSFHIRADADSADMKDRMAVGIRGLLRSPDQ